MDEPVDEPVDEPGRGDFEGDALNLIHTGMMVFDRDGQQVGTVDGVFHGRPEDQAAAAAAGSAAPAAPASPGRATSAEDPSGGSAAEGQGTAGRGETLQDYPAPPGTPPPVETSDVGLQATLGEPEMWRGYIHLGGTDLPERARYVAAELIERRDDWRVYLKVSLAELERGEAGAPG